MKCFFRQFLLAVPLLLICSISAPMQVRAEDPLNAACQNGSIATDSATCKSRSPTKNPLTGSDGMLMKVSRIVAIVAGMIAVIIIMVGSFRYVTSGGDTQKLSSAKNTIIGALIGLVIIVLAQAILTFVVMGIK